MLALCPHCLETRDLREVHDPGRGPVLRCDNPACDDPIVPRLYGEDYAAHPPVPVGVVALSGHGRATFLDALAGEIEAAGARWADARFSFTWLGEGKPRGPRARTPREEGRTAFGRPRVLRLSGVPRVGGCQLVLSDGGGEVFLDPAAPADAARHIRRSSAVVWLLSLKPGDPYNSPDDVGRAMAAYLRAVSRSDQNLLLVLTKGDELLRRPDLPGSAREALAMDDCSPCGPVWSTLERVSADLENWLRSDRCGYRHLVELARSRFKAVRYCVASARGQPPCESPRGVLTPLLWLWRIDRDPVWVERGGAADLYLDLNEAVARAGGGTVRLDERVYRLAAPLNVTQPVTLLGRGMGRTVLEVAAPGYGVGVRTDGRVTLGGLTVRRTAGGPPGDVIRVLGGELELRDVAVTGALSGEVNGKPVGGHGLVAAKQARLTAAGCASRSNHGNGALVMERAAAELTGCTFESNGDAGVYVRTTGTVMMTQCACRENHTGVWVEAAAKACVTANTCERNAESGVVLSGHVGGSVVVRGNTCTGNGRDGVHARTAAAPTVVGNTCTVNRRNGVAFTDQSAGTARGNTCTLNGRHGLRVCDDAAPILEENVAEGNAGCGLLYEDRGGGVGRGNVCRDNRGDGIRLEGASAPQLADNEATLNDGYGIAIAEPRSKAEVDPAGNTAEGNRRGTVLDPRPKKRDSWWGR
jgi:parallel beta-helix repeat protein